MYLQFGRQSFVPDKQIVRGHLSLGVCGRAAKESGRIAAQKCQAKNDVGRGEGCF
jgi:hypothetical protein